MRRSTGRAPTCGTSRPTSTARRSRGKACSRSSRRRTPSSPTSSTTRFDELQALLDAQREGDGFVAYDELTPDAGQGPLRRRQRPLRAAVAADRGGAVLTDQPTPDRAQQAGPAGRGSRGSQASRAPSPQVGRRRTPDRATRRSGPARARGDVRLPWRAPGRDRHPGPGPAALRRVRRAHRLPRRARRPAAGVDRRGRADDRRRARGRGRRRSGATCACPRRHGGGARPAGERPDDHLRLRPVAVPRRRGHGPLRHRRPAAGGAARAAALPGRRPRPGALGRRPVHPGVRRRPAGRGARGPQPGPHRLRHGVGPVVAARLRPHLDHVDQPIDAAQPVRLQGRHRQRQGRGGRRARRARVGRRRRRRGRIVARGRVLPGGAPDQHDDRGLGPTAAGRPGDVRGPDQGHGRTAVGRRGAHRARLRHARQQRPAGHPGRRARAGRAPRPTRRGTHAAARLQLRRRLERPRRARRGALLHRLRP